MEHYRPTRHETEEDILRQQEEFLKNKSTPSTNVTRGTSVISPTHVHEPKSSVTILSEVKERLVLYDRPINAECVSIDTAASIKSIGAQVIPGSRVRGQSLFAKQFDCGKVSNVSKPGVKKNTASVIKPELTDADRIIAGQSGY